MSNSVSADLLTPVILPPLHRRLQRAGAHPWLDANTLTIQPLDVLPGSAQGLQHPSRLQRTLPGVILWRGFVAGENQVQLYQYLRAQLQLHCAQRCLQLPQCARPDDRRRHARLLQQPRQRHIARLGFDFITQLLLLPDLRPDFFKRLFCTSHQPALAIPFLL